MLLSRHLTSCQMSLQQWISVPQLKTPVQDILRWQKRKPASNVNYKHAPDDINTRYGKLEFPGGYPTEATIQKVYDELDLQNATQLYLDMYPALSMNGMIEGIVRDYGTHSSSYIGVTANRLDSKALFNREYGKYLFYVGFRPKGRWSNGI